MNSTFFNFFSKQIVLTLLIVSFLFTLFIPFFSIIYSDNPYQINLANYFIKNATYFSVLTFLSQFIYAKTILVFGDYFIVLKLLNSLFVFFTVYTPLLLFYKKIDTKKYILFATIALFLFLPFSRLSIGWDAISDFFLIISVCFFIKYLHNSNLKYILILSVVITCSIYAKITNVLLLPFLLVGYIIYTKINKKHINFKHLILFVVCFLIVFNGFLFFFFNAPLEYYSNLKGNEDLNDSYTVLGLLERVYNHLKFGIKPLVVFVFYYLVFIKFSSIKHAVYFKILWFLLYVLLVYNYVSIERSYYIYVLVLSFSLIGFLFFEVFLNKKIVLQSKFLIVFLLIISFFPTIGSNTGLTKINLILYFPLILTLNTFKIEISKYKTFILCTLAYIFILRFFYFIDHQPIYSEYSINKGKLYPVISHIGTPKRLEKLDQFLEDKNVNTIYFYGLYVEYSG